MKNEDQLQSVLTFALPSLPEYKLPKLPEILDPELRELVFTHSSFHARPRNAMFLEEGGKIMDNEKLEHVGDALLGGVITVLLDELFPTLKQGPATTLKALLVRNDTLAQLSRRYGFPDRLLANRADLYNLRKGEKTVANLFETYVAGVFYSHLKTPVGLPRIPTPPRTPTKTGSAETDLPSSSSSSSSLAKPTHGDALNKLNEWLRPVFTPLAQWALDQMKQEQARLEALTAEKGGDADLDKDAAGALARLNEYFIAKQGGIPEIVASREGSDMWRVMVIARMNSGTTVDAEATRTTKKAASTVAAWKICQRLNL